MTGTPVVAIAKAVADAKDVAPSDLDLSLNDYVDPEAITDLANHGESSWTLSFELPEHEVTVTSDGLVLVDGRREELWA